MNASTPNPDEDIDLRPVIGYLVHHLAKGVEPQVALAAAQAYRHLPRLTEARWQLALERAMANARATVLSSVARKGVTGGQLFGRQPKG